jgi:hypothetical protein
MVVTAWTSSWSARVADSRAGVGQWEYVSIFYKKFSCSRYWYFFQKELATQNVPIT